MTYTYNFNDIKYEDYVCILSVVAQISIDNAKRRYAIDIEKEIARIKNDLDIETNGLPKFWQITKKDKRKARSDAERIRRKKINKKKIQSNINENLVCPMNYLYDMTFSKYHSSVKTKPMKDFFVNHIQQNDRRKSRKVEELIEKYSFKLYQVQVDYGANNINWSEDEQILLLRNDFENLIQDIRSIYISKNYIGLMSWLINRAFCITKQTNGNMSSNLYKNRAILIKVLYEVNPDAFLKCFVKM